MARWQMMLGEYDVVVDYTLKKLNVAADTLSCIHD